MTLSWKETSFSPPCHPYTHMQSVAINTPANPEHDTKMWPIVRTSHRALFLFQFPRFFYKSDKTYQLHHNTIIIRHFTSDASSNMFRHQVDIFRSFVATEDIRTLVAPDGSGCSTSRDGRFNPGQRVHVFQLKWRWVGPRAGLKSFGEEKIVLLLQNREVRPTGWLKQGFSIFFVC